MPYRPAPNLTTPLASRKFFVTVRWFVILASPLLVGLSPMGIPVLTWYVLGVFAAVNVALQYRLRRPYSSIDTGLMYLAFAADLVLATCLVYTRGGFRTDAYLLYILVANEVGLVLGFWQSLLAWAVGLSMYAGTLVFLMGETDYRRLAIRSVYLVLIGVVTAYLASSEKKALVAALTDCKTHIPNFRHFRESLALEITQHLQWQRPLSVALLDVDNFKQLNAQIGHPHADRVLEQLADLLLRNKRPPDLLARYGGEEFAVLLPGADLKAAAAAMERFRTLAAAEPFLRESGEPIHITVSVGVATLDLSASEWSLLVDADSALQEAKQTGKNRVIAHANHSAPATGA